LERGGAGVNAPIPVFACRLTPTGLKVDDRTALANYARTLGDGMLELVVRKHKAQRTSKANRYYWGVVIHLLSEHTGYEPDEMHEALAFKFLRIEDCPITGTPRRKRTPKTNTSEFAEYVDQCVRFASGLGVVIPDPSQVEAI
jgi:hypothetical protein